jgi:hypothetical protein
MNSFFSLIDGFTSSTAEQDEKFHYPNLASVYVTVLLHFCISTIQALKLTLTRFCGFRELGKSMQLLLVDDRTHLYQ